MKGNQKPRIQIEPLRVGTDGADAALLMGEYGVELDEWQKLVLDCWLGYDAQRVYTATSCGLSLSRQNGKNVAIEAREFYGLVINGERILHSAHQSRTAKKSFRRLVNMFSDKKHPEIEALVKKIRFGAGEESIELNNGGIIEFIARSRQAARGYDGISLIVFDEAQELNDEQIESLMSTLSASTTGNRQLIYMGTPPYIGCTGEVFKRYRESCLMSADKNEISHSCWHEWSIEADTIEDIDVSDKRLWYAANPALGTRLTEEFTTEEFKTLSPDGFARERLGVWFKPHVEKIEAAISPELWDRCKSDEPKPDGKTAYGVKFSADGSEVCLCGAVIPKVGRPRISLIRREPTGIGISWLAQWLNERYRQASCVVIDGRNGADVLIEKICNTWIFKGSVIKASTQNVTTAASMLMNELTEENVTWYSQQEDLRESALSSNKRTIGGGWGFGGADSTPIEAASLALWGVRTSKRDPTKKMRISF